MNKKVFWVDTETTGIFDDEHPKKYDILQLAYLIEINKEVVEEGSFYCQPFNYTTINAQALEVNKLTIAKIKEFPSPQETYRKLKIVLNKYIDNYTRGHDKFSPAGYNVGFDTKFLKQFFLKNNDEYYNSFFDYHLLSIDSLLYMFDHAGLIKLENYKLVTVAKYFNIDFSAHDALSDIKTTRQVFYKLLEYFK